MINEGTLPKSSVEGFLKPENIKGKFSGNGRYVDPKSGAQIAEKNQQPKAPELGDMVLDLISVKGVIARFKGMLIAGGSTRSASGAEMGKIHEMTASLEAKQAEIANKLAAMKEKTAAQKDQPAAKEPKKAGKEVKMTPHTARAMSEAGRKRA